MGVAFFDVVRESVRVARSTVDDVCTAVGAIGFRAREKAALGRLVAGAPAVVATGGGTAVDPDNLGRMRQRGVVVSLAADLEVSLARAAGGIGRPLLGRPADEV